MDEVYTCICNGQSWTIHYDFIRCVKCNRKYNILPQSPRSFNEDREDERRMSV